MQQVFFEKIKLQKTINHNWVWKYIENKKTGTNLEMQKDKMSYEQQETSKAKRRWSKNISEVRDKQR